MLMMLMMLMMLIRYNLGDLPIKYCLGVLLDAFGTVLCDYWADMMI